jgi:hypothetical protein
MPEKFRSRLAHPEDDFMEASIDGIHDDKIVGAVMHEIDAIVGRYGGACCECGLLTRGVEGLVLTEWKVADDATSAAKGFAKLGLRPTSAGVVCRINIVVQPAVPSKALEEHHPFEGQSRFRSTANGEEKRARELTNPNGTPPSREPPPSITAASAQ